MEAKQLAEVLERMKGRFGRAYEPQEAKVLYARCKALTAEELNRVVDRVYAAGSEYLPSLNVWRDAIAYVRPHTPSPQEPAPSGPRVSRNAVREARARICEGMKSYRPGKNPIGNRTEDEIQAEIQRLGNRTGVDAKAAMVALRWVIGGQRQAPSEYFEAMREALKANGNGEAKS